MTARKSEERAKIREEMLRTSNELCSRDDRSGLGIALRGFSPSLRHAFILRWIPEQAEDIYWVLVSPAELVKIEIPRVRNDNEISSSLELIDLINFKKNLPSQEVRMRLDIALELIEV
ncbi:hypothetical protein [Ralstonia pseudosolanacearum]